MDRHHDVHQNPFTSTLSSPTSSPTGTKAKLLSRINKLVRPSDNNGIFGLRSPTLPRGTTRPAPSSTAADTFRIVHEPDRMPLYSPPTPINPRTERECEEALKEMFAQASEVKMAESGGISEEQARTTSLTVPGPRYDDLVDGQEPNKNPHDCGGPSMSNDRRPLFIAIPKDGMATIHSEQLGLQAYPIPTRPEGGERLQSSPGSPMTPVTAVFMPTAANRVASRPMKPSTPRSTDSHGVQSVISGESARAPRLLSQRALIALDSTARVTKQGTNMHSTLSPLSWSPVSTVASSRSPGLQVTDVAKKLPKTPPRPRRDDAEAWARKPGSSMRSARADAWASSDSDEVGAKTTTLSQSDSGEAHSTERVENTRAQAPRTPPNKRCLICPEFRRGEARLCDRCWAKYEPRDSDIEDSDSDYEDIEVRTPSLSPPTLSPRRTKPLAIGSTPTRPSQRGNSTSFSRTISWPKATPSPRGSSTPRTPGQELYRFSSRSLSISPTPYVAKKLEVFPSPPLRRVSIPSPARVEASESALYHLGRRMMSEGGDEVIRVGSVQSGEGQVVYCPDDDDNENGDTMKMLADESQGVETRAAERKHEAGGSD